MLLMFLGHPTTGEKMFVILCIGMTGPYALALSTVQNSEL